MTSSRFAGIVPADTVIQRSAEGTEFSTKANDLNQGFDQVTPKDFGGAGGITTGLPSDLQGPNGFNLPNAASQNVVTDVNKAGTDDKGGMRFSAYDEPSDPYKKASLPSPKMDSQGLGDNDAD